MWKSLDPFEKAKYRQLELERLDKCRKEFIEKHLLAGEFEEKYGSDFDKVIAHVAQLFKVGCSNFFIPSITMCRSRRTMKH